MADQLWSDTIAWLRPDGGISITYCPPGTDLEAHRDALAVDPGAPYSGYTFVGFNLAMPAKDEFRDALTWRDNALVHDMDRAREIRTDQLRAERAPMLAALDVDYMRADETGDATAKARIAARKQALRDVTKAPALAAAATLDDLRAVRLA